MGLTPCRGYFLDVDAYGGGFEDFEEELVRSISRKLETLRKG